MIATADEASVGIDRLRAAVRGTVALPGEAGYELSASWNLMVQLRRVPSSPRRTARTSSTPSGSPSPTAIESLS